MKNIKYTLLEHILNEGRLEDTIKKYTQVPEPVVRELSQADPSGNNKYLDWMVRTLVQAPQQKADIIAKIKCFHENVARLSDNHVKGIYGEEKWRNPSTEHKAVLEGIRKTPKDINAYPSHLWIEPMCGYFEEQKPKNASRVKIFEDEKWLVVSPLTHAASCSYGAHSNWCVSTSNSSYFGNYTQNGILVFFIDKKGFNVRKKDANSYKFAVNINYDQPAMENWAWYSMEDQSIDPRLMMNLVPKHLLDVTEKYFKDVLKELGKQSAVDEEDLNKNSNVWFQSGSNYYIFPKFENWDEASMNTAAEYLKKYNQNRPFELARYKEQGLPYFIIQTRTGRLPYINQQTATWNVALNNRQADNTVLLSKIIEVSDGRWGGFYNLTSLMKPEQKSKFYQEYMKMFNGANITRNQQTRTSELAVGDTILFRPHGRQWGNGEPVTVSRVAEKSLQLSNGKRIARTTTSYKDKVLGVTKIVDDTAQVNQQGVRTESRWIRKRII